MAMATFGIPPPIAVLGVLSVEMDSSDAVVYLKCKNIIVY